MVDGKRRYIFVSFEIMIQDLARYMCPNRHPYYTDKCGGPTGIFNTFVAEIEIEEIFVFCPLEILQCKTCGRDIGGLDHKLLEDNIDIGYGTYDSEGKLVQNKGGDLFKTTILEDNSDRNYCLREASDESDVHASARALDPVTTRSIRLLMHLALLTGGSANRSTWGNLVNPLFNPNYGLCARLDPSGDCARAFFYDHVVADGALLRQILTRSIDDVFLLLHLLLSKGTTLPFSLPGQSSPNRSDLAEVPSDFLALRTTQMRKAWEGWFFTGMLHYTRGDNLDALLDEAQLKLSAGDDGSAAFVAELVDKMDIAALNVGERVARAPALFTYTRRFNFSHFTNTLQCARDSRERYPVLSYFVDNQNLKTLTALRFLPQLLEWPRLLKIKFHGHLDREMARTKSCAEVLDSIPEAERPRWDAAFHGFCAAWWVVFSARYLNLSLPFIHSGTMVGIQL